MASLLFHKERGNAWTEITHAQNPRRAEAVRRRHVQTPDRRQPWGERDRRPGLHFACAARRPRLAAAGRPDGRDAGGSALSAAYGRQQGTSATARLGDGAPRAAPARGDATAVVGGASRRPPRRLRL